MRGGLAALALFCLFVQSLIPLGWMPSGNSALFELCAVTHAQDPLPDTGPTGKADPHAPPQACPFAGVGLWTKIDGSTVTTAPSHYEAGAAPLPRAGHTVARAIAGAPLGSRAPPRA